MVDLGEQQQARARVARQGLAIGLDHPVMVERFGQHDALHLHPTPRLQPAHRGDHAVVVDVGIQHAIARRQPVVAADQHLHGLGGATGQRDLVDVHAQRLGQLLPRLFKQGRERPPPEPGVARVHRRSGLLVGVQHRARHRAPVAVVEHHHLVGEVVQRAHLAPEGFVGGQLRRRVPGGSRPLQRFGHCVPIAYPPGVYARQHASRRVCTMRAGRARRIDATCRTK
ncbi:hypothetical protein D3C71_1364320 [compost metagenome]